MQNRDFWIRVTCHYGSKTSPVDLWMQNHVLWYRMTLVYWSQHSSVVLCIQTTTLAPELQVSIGPSPHQWCYAFTRATLASQWLVSMLSAFICGFVHSKQRLQRENYQSLWLPALNCGLCMQNRDFRTRITSLHGTQPSSVVVCIHNSDIMTRINCLYGSQTSPVVLCMQNSVISSRISSLHGSQTSRTV